MTVSSAAWQPKDSSTSYLGAEYTVLVTDSNLTVLGDPISDWTQLQTTLRWKEPGSGQITVPAHRYIREQLVPGCRIVILRRLFDQQHTLIAGPMEQLLRERSDDGENGGVGTLTITFTDDLAWLGARIAIPDPKKLAAAQTSDFWTYSGDAANNPAADPVAVMLKLVDTQAGPGALADRRIPRLITNVPNPITGTKPVVIKSRLEKVTDVLRRITTLGAGAGYGPDSLGFATRQAGDQILFEALRARDLSGQVHFSFAAGNLQFYSWELNAPELTHPYVGGQYTDDDKTAGVGANKFFDLFPTSRQQDLRWGRYESYEPFAGNAKPSELQDQATQALKEKGESGRLASNASDTPDQRFGVHYNVGDIVSLELDVGEFITAPVQTINVQVYPTAGEVAGVTIGDQSTSYKGAYVRTMRAIDRRVGDLERVMRRQTGI